MAKLQPRIILLFSITVLLSGCYLFKKQQPKATPYPDWVKNSVVYEINTRQYSPEGTFKALEADLPRIKDLGIDILWLMPIYPIGEKNRKVPDGAKTSLGSYYSIRDYKAINPEFGTADDFKSLVTKAHEMGFRVIIDWVANHTARDNSWITEHPDWYKKDDKGAIATPFDWTDCAQLDYTKKELRKEMVGSMKFWITNFDIDGFRCDMAGLVPTDFWEDTRAELLKIKPLYLLAENEDKPEMCKIAFDSNYGWEMHHLMTAITQKKKGAGELLKLQSKIDSTLPVRAFKLNFITNHDENSWNGTAKEKFGDGEKSCAVLTYTLPGMPLVYSGQEAGMTKRLRFFAKDTIDWSDTRMIPFYKTLNGLKHRNQALWNPPFGGKLIPLTNSAPDKIVSFLRSADNARVMVLVNMSPDTITADITTPVADGQYSNTFNHNKINFNADNRRCYFEPWEYIVLEGEKGMKE
jgi:glycosidase